MSSANTFEIRIFKNNRWTTESRCNSQAEAMTLANSIAAERTTDGVKVVEEAYDENQGLFREKTLFSYFRQDDKVLNSRRARQADESPDTSRPPARPMAKPGPNHDVRAWLLVLALVASLGGNLGLAFYLGDRPLPDFIAGRVQATDRTATGDLVVYDLPEVTMNYKTHDGTRAVKMKLGLELSSREDMNDVQRRLAQIVNRVADDLSGLSDSDLDGSAGMEKLRKSLQQGVRAAAPESNIEGVLFKEVLVF